MTATAQRIAIINNQTGGEQPNLGTIYGIGFNILQGSLAPASINEVEELIAAGVDGRRIRIRRKIDGPIILRITESLPDATPFADYERDVRQYQGRLVNVVLTFNGDQVIYRDLFCFRVSIVQRMPGEVVGFGGGANTKAIQYDVELLRS